MDSIVKLHKTSGDPLPAPTIYRTLLGRLIYLTRPNISYAVGSLGQFLASLTTLHFQEALRILRYLKESLGSGLFFPTKPSLKLTSFIDSDRECLGPLLKLSIEHLHNSTSFM